MQMPLHLSCDPSPARPRLATTPKLAMLFHQRLDRSVSRIPLRRGVGLNATRYVLCITGARKATPAARLGQLPCGTNVPPVRHPPFGVRHQRKARGRSALPLGSARDQYQRGSASLRPLNGLQALRVHPVLPISMSYDADPGATCGAACEPEIESSGWISLSYRIGEFFRGR